MSINTTSNYSPNFDLKKRKSQQIKFIIFHYTGMKYEKDAIERLTSFKSKVSCHYFIKNNGKVLNLVPDLYTSWHSGISFWKKYKLINRYSIGIEISNPGHNNKYKKFSRNQINALIKLSKFLINKYKIKKNFILGHSDIAPNRKKDPGEKFPWKELSKKKIGFWHNLDHIKLLNLRCKKVSEHEKKIFFKNLYKIGYSIKSINKNQKFLMFIIKAFQRRFRPEIINGIIDKECLIISKDLIKIK